MGLDYGGGVSLVGDAHVSAAWVRGCEANRTGGALTCAPPPIHTIVAELDLGDAKLILRAEIRRLSCRRCGRVRTEEVP
jgi:hypothetical protein